MNAIEYAEQAGREFARENMHEIKTYPDSWRPYNEHDDIPEGDWDDMTCRFGDVTAEMERAYKDGFNSERDTNA